MFLVQPFYGMLADRLGYKKCLLLSSGLASISYALYLVDASFIWIVFVTIFMSVFYNAIQPILDSLSLRLAQDNPKFSYGTLRIAGAAGWAFTGIITGQLIDAINTTVIFLISAISMFLTFIFAFSLKADKKITVAETGQSFQNIKEILKNRTLLFLLTCVFLISAGASTIWYFYSIYMKENGASASLVGYGFRSRDYVNCHCFIFLQGSLPGLVLKQLC